MMIHPIQDFLANALGQGVAARCERVTDGKGLMPLEAKQVAHAVPSRIAEFAAGRRAARAAFGDLGLASVELPIGPDRAPIWPAGITGSISHDNGLAISAVVSMNSGRSMGIDLTEAAPLPLGTREIVLPHEEERDLNEIEARAAFSAKESLFKALSPIVGEIFGFTAAVARLDETEGRFDVCLVQSLASFKTGETWTGYFGVAGGRLVTALLIEN